MISVRSCLDDPIEPPALVCPSTTQSISPPSVSNFHFPRELLLSSVCSFEEIRTSFHLVFPGEHHDEEDDVEVERIPVFSADVRGRPAGVVLEDLEWRLEKLRLEEANTRRFLKSRPRFLPYRECQKWVQAWGERWTSAEEWCVKKER